MDEEDQSQRRLCGHKSRDWSDAAAAKECQSPLEAGGDTEQSSVSLGAPRGNSLPTP